MISTHFLDQKRNLGATKVTARTLIYHSKYMQLHQTIEVVFVKQVKWRSPVRWMGNHVPTKVWAEITYTFPNSMVAPLKFGNRLVISSHTL